MTKVPSTLDDTQAGLAKDLFRSVKKIISKLRVDG